MEATDLFYGVSVCIGKACSVPKLRGGPRFKPEPSYGAWNHLERVLRHCIPVLFCFINQDIK